MASSAAAPKIINLSLDVHKDSVTVAVLPADASAPTRIGTYPNDFAKLRRVFERHAKDGELQACSEASGAGYVLQRAMTAWGYHCAVIAPSLIPIKPGVQRKHDTYDAGPLARLYRAGELTVIRIPIEAEERVRDVVRCRETLRREVVTSRHDILKFLARRGVVYREGVHWRPAHYTWLRQLTGTTSPLAEEDRLVFGEYFALLEYKLSRRDALDAHIAALALTPNYAAAVETLQCFRGLQVHGAMVLATELVDWRRFASPRQLMAYLGVVPREHSSGARERRGSITKAGNAHCRHVLVQAAWAYRLRPNIGPALAMRQRGQPAAVTLHTWKAPQRVYTMSHRLSARHGPQIAVVAVARELIGYLWAVMRDATVPIATAGSAAPVAAESVDARRTRHRRHGSPSVRQELLALGMGYGGGTAHHRIPGPGMSALQTNPLRATPAWRHADRRRSAGFIVEDSAGTRDLVRAPITPHQTKQRDAANRPS